MIALNRGKSAIGASRYRLLLLIILIVPYPLSAEEERLNRQIMQVSGITEEDSAEAVSKKMLRLYDLYAIAVKHSESLMIEYENVVQAEAGRQQAIGSL